MMRVFNGVCLGLMLVHVCLGFMLAEEERTEEPFLTETAPTNRMASDSSERSFLARRSGPSDESLGGSRIPVLDGNGFEKGKGVAEPSLLESVADAFLQKKEISRRLQKKDGSSTQQNTEEAQRQQGGQQMAHAQQKTRQQMAHAQHFKKKKKEEKEKPEEEKDPLAKQELKAEVQAAGQDNLDLDI